MPVKATPSPLRGFQCLRSTTNASPIPPLCVSTTSRTSLVSSTRNFRYRFYSTTRSRSKNSNFLNYKTSLYCLAAAGATWAATNLSRPTLLDAAPSGARDSLSSGTAKVEVTGKDHGDEVDMVATGTSTIPYFPRTIWLPQTGSARDEGRSASLPVGVGAAEEEGEYQLLGLGIRTVSLFGFQVYVVGLYVAKGDMGRLQEKLVRASLGNGASTLVQGEKEEFKKVLLDGKGSQRVWDEVLKEGGVRSAFRIVPTRNTNYAHLRDGWVRGIDARSKGPEFENEAFKASVSEFKGMLGGRGSVGKGKVLLLGRGANGDLSAWVDEEMTQTGEVDRQAVAKKGGHMSLLGRIQDEKISRLVWMGYLGGGSVASEEVRQNVVDGVMEIVGRPIGTVETQVV